MMERWTMWMRRFRDLSERMALTGHDSQMKKKKKNEVGLLPHTMYENELKTDH